MMPLPWHRETLERFLADRERLPHALLVHGPDGVGKVEFVHALAASVLCERPRGGLACGECASCRWFAQGNHPDYREIVPEAVAEERGRGTSWASEDGEAEAPQSDKAKSIVIKVDQIRNVADFVALTTHRGGYRVLAIHPAEALHPAAANALLKTLEEPPPASLIVLVADNPARLLPTIASRCRRLALAAPPRAAALAWLRAEDVAEPERALDNAGGAPLLARSLATPDEAELRRRVLAELARPGGAEALQFAPAIERANLERFIFWMQTWVHDLVRARLAGEVRHHRDFDAALKRHARASDLEALLDLDRALAEARGLASHPLNPRLVAEHLLMAYNRAIMPSSP
jgi:DNA polymerase-3 subunit delta'